MCIGSDDPGIFACSLRGEYIHVLREAMHVTKGSPHADGAIPRLHATPDRKYGCEHYQKESGAIMSIDYRPDNFPMAIQGGMLEALGINMYTSIGKCLVEFVANAYDSDARTVGISIPEGIAPARAAMREAAKKAVANGEMAPFRVLLEPLSDDFKIVITDDGHGMTPREVEERFLPINRRRRADDTGDETKMKSESGRRYVMGRKGLGKLAGFGAAELVTIRTKRAGETFATVFKLDYNDLKNAYNLAAVQIPASYEEGRLPEEQGTTVTLSRLKCDAVKYTVDTVRSIIAESFFGIDPADFEVVVNGAPCEEPLVHYEYLYPEHRGADGYASAQVNIDGGDPITIDYVVKFRAREPDLKQPEAKFGHLDAVKRGARIYCNKRLAAGPSLFKLPTGMHNFHSQSYMECLVRADQLDRLAVDLVNTNRTQLREDNEIVDSLIDKVTDFMKSAIAAHAKFREFQAINTVEKAEETRHINKIIDRLPRRQKAAAKKILQTLVSVHGVQSAEFAEMAPLIINSMNAGDVLVRLIELNSDPGSVEKIANHLSELAEIERSDALKLYRGRRSGITALQALTDKGEDTWRKGPRFEKELHELLKKYPWLIKPEYARFLTSDADMGKVVTALAKTLSIDTFAKPLSDGSIDDTRPDLVFLMSDSASPYMVTVVELKSPNIPLDIDHLQQLKSYIRQIREWLDIEYPRKEITVQGYLIGAKPDPATTARKCRDLMAEISERSMGHNWEVLGLRELLDRAYTVHMDAITALEKAEDEDAKDGEDGDLAALLAIS